MPIAVRPGQHLTLGLAVLLLFLPCAVADGPPSPRDELLRFVPEDVTVCCVLQGLRDHAKALADSPFVEQIRKLGLGAKLRESPELEKLDALEKKLKKDVGIDWDTIRNELLGDAIAFAYKKPAARTDPEQGLILLRARSARALADLVERLNKAQKDKGELTELEEIPYGSAKYYRRAERKGRAYFYSLRGPVLIFSGEEGMLRRALDLEAKGPASAAPPLARRLNEGGAEHALVAVWLNPRALDSEIEGKDAGEDAEKAAASKTFATCWKALDGIVWSVALDRDLSTSLSFQARPEAMPSGIRRFLAEAARPSDLWRAFPEDAFVAVALRVHAPSLFDAVGELMPAKDRQEGKARLDEFFGAFLEKDLKEVLPAIGPDIGWCVAPPAAGDKNWFPQVIAAVRLGPGEGRTGLDQRIVTVLQDVAVPFAVVGVNKKSPDSPVRAKSEQDGKQTIKYLVSDQFPPGLRPALALREGFLVLASSPEVVRRFGLTAPLPTGGAPLVRISFKSFRTYLEKRRDVLAEALAGKEGISRDDAARRLDDLRDNLELLDRAELRVQTSTGRATFTLSLQPSHALRK